MPTAGAGVDADAARRSIDRLMAIYADISRAAEDSFKTRCPYKDARSRCSAKFPCQNQRSVRNRTGELPVCVGSDRLDYRAAWDLG